MSVSNVEKGYKSDKSYTYFIFPLFFIVLFLLIDKLVVSFFQKPIDRFYVDGGMVFYSRFFGSIKYYLYLSYHKRKNTPMKISK